MRKNNTETDKRSILIGAILNNDKVKLQELSNSNGKRVIVLDSFLDGLIWSSNGGFEDPSITFVCTDRYNQMWEGIANNINH